VQILTPDELLAGQGHSQALEEKRQAQSHTAALLRQVQELGRKNKELEDKVAALETSQAALHAAVRVGQEALGKAEELAQTQEHAAKLVQEDRLSVEKRMQKLEESRGALADELLGQKKVSADVC